MKTLLRLLVVLATVGGGCTGILCSVPLLDSLRGNGLRYALAVFIAITVYSLITASGLLFVFDANRTLPLVFAFAMQIPWIDVPGFRYQIFSLLYAAITLGPPHGNDRFGFFLEWTANLGTHAEIRIGGFAGGDWSLGVNLFAMLMAIFLRQYGRASKTSPVVDLNSQKPES